jgi:hypothetical protein
LKSTWPMDMPSPYSNSITTLELPTHISGQGAPSTMVLHRSGGACSVEAEMVPANGNRRIRTC